jgi:ketosteroid isomerase-like protein
MDTAALHEFYRCYRERRLAEAVALLSDDFLFKAHIPNAPHDPLRPRSRAEFTLICHKFLDAYDILTFEPGPFTLFDGVASAPALGVFRHKKTGRMLELTFRHTWRVVNGKLTELIQEYDVEKVQAFLKDVDGDGGDGAEPL